MVFSSGDVRWNELHSHGFGLLSEVIQDALAIALLEVILTPVILVPRCKPNQDANTETIWLLIVYKKIKFDNLPTSFLVELKQGVEDAL